MADALAAYDEEAVMEDSARFAGDKRLLVRFYKRPVHNQFKSNEEGRPIFDERIYVRIIVPGDKHNILDTPATREHTHIRFADQYAKFMRNEEQVVSGTPLKVWPPLSITQVAELNALNITTVEQLADLPDNLAQQFMGFNGLRQKAKLFLDAAKDGAASSKLLAELAERDNKIGVMEANMAALTEQLNKLVAAQAAEKTAKAIPAAK
jgi:hypothetical protein